MNKDDLYPYSLHADIRFSVIITDIQFTGPAVIRFEYEMPSSYQNAV